MPSEQPADQILEDVKEELDPTVRILELEIKLKNANIRADALEALLSKEKENHQTIRDILCRRIGELS